MNYTIEAWEMTIKDFGAAPADCVPPARFEILEDSYERGNTQQPGHDIHRVGGYGEDGAECFRLEEISEWSFDPKTVDKRRIREARLMRQLKTDGEWLEFSLDRLAK